LRRRRKCHLDAARVHVPAPVHSRDGPAAAGPMPRHADES
jgi:hypothetical protein